MTSPSEANLLVHYEDFELAQSVKRELMQLRSRPTMPTSEDIMLVGRKAALTGSSPRAGRAAVDNIRAEAWLAICKLAAAIDGNARLLEENQPDALVNTSLLWARAIDLGQAWMRVAEQPRRELADLTTASHDIEARATQALALAPTPAPILRIDDASAISKPCPPRQWRDGDRQSFGGGPHRKCNNVCYRQSWRFVFGRCSHRSRHRGLPQS